MSAAVATLALVLSLVPGAAAAAAYKMVFASISDTFFVGETRIRWSSDGPSVAGISISIVPVSMLIHILLLKTPVGAIVLIQCYIRFRSLLATDPIKAATLVPDDLMQCAWYFGLSLMLGLMVGAAAGLAFWPFRWKIRRARSWAYELKRPSGGRRQETAISATVLTTPTFSRGGDASAGSLLVFGFLSDLFLRDDGSVQSLVFLHFNISVVDMATASLLWPEHGEYAVPPNHRFDERLVIEGRNVALIAYQKLRMPRFTNDDLQKLQRAVEDDQGAVTDSNAAEPAPGSAEGRLPGLSD
jgi:hypothetical protein